MKLPKFAGSGLVDGFRQICAISGETPDGIGTLMRYDDGTRPL